MIKLESYTDYPKQASENAKIALRYAEENGWGSCGTAVGKQRANQLAKGEPISRETIARMAAFERHRQNSKKPLGDGCGRLMWLAWGGDAGINWAQRKLKQIDKQKNLKMTTYQNVLNRLNKKTEKTELKSEKVELSIIDDLNKALTNSDKVIKELTQKFKSIDLYNKWLTKDSKEISKAKEVNKKAADKFFKLEDQFLKSKGDYKKSSEDLENKIKKKDGNLKRLAGDKKALNKILVTSRKTGAIFVKNITKAEKAAKDLGLKLPIGKYKNALAKLKELDEKINSILNVHRTS